MTLLEWKQKTGLSWREMAEKFGASHGVTVRRWCLKAGDKGKMYPSPQFMVTIFKVTEGLVAPNDFYDLD